MKLSTPFKKVRGEKPRQTPSPSPSSSSPSSILSHPDGSAVDDDDSIVLNSSENKVLTLEDSDSTDTTEIMSPDISVETPNLIINEQRACFSISAPPFQTVDEDHVSVSYSNASSSTTSSTSLQNHSRSSSSNDVNNAGRRSSLKKPGSPYRRKSSHLSRNEFEIWLPHRDEPIRRSSCITFDEMVQVKKVRPVKQLASSYKDLWFDDEDYDAMRQKNRRLIHRVENNLTGGRNYCVRGLETMMKGHTSHCRFEARTIGWDSVLDEQEIQSITKVYDDERIALAYSRSSIRNKREALRRASIDEQAARAYHDRCSTTETQSV